MWLTATAGALVLARWVLPDLAVALRVLAAHGGAPPTFDQLLLWLFAAAALAGAGWLWTVTTLVTTEALLGRDPTCTGARRGVPTWLRHLVLTACGVALAGGVSSPALATPGQLHQDRTGTAGQAVVRGLPLPDRAEGRRRGHGPDRVVVVRPGDTLWGLAARQLPGTADDAGIAARSRAIYALNRDVIGDDPDLIHPAQRLRLPGS